LNIVQYDRVTKNMTMERTTTWSSLGRDGKEVDLQHDRIIIERAAEAGTTPALPPLESFQSMKGCGL
jgi:hypothetical protein